MFIYMYVCMRLHALPSHRFLLCTTLEFEMTHLIELNLIGHNSKILYLLSKLLVVRGQCVCVNIPKYTCKYGHVLIFNKKN